MNSKKLIETFPSIYEEFFWRNSIIVSSPLLVNRCDDLFPDFSGVSIKQKIPFRLYAWISKNNLKKITLNKISYRDDSDNKFIQADMLWYAPCFYNILETLNKKYSHIVKKYWWFEINMLGELGRWKWLAFGSITSLLISALCKRLEWTFNQEVLTNSDKITINEAINDENLWIRDVLLDSYEIDLDIYGKIFYTGKVSTLFNSHYPIISFTEDNPSNNINWINKSHKHFWFRMWEMFKGLKEIPYLPVDRWFIYTWKPILLEQIINRNLINISMYTEMRKEFKGKFDWYFKDLLPTRKPKFYTDLIEWNEEILTETYSKIMGIISLEILYFMYNLYSQWYSDQDMRFFKKSLEKIRYANHITRENSESLIIFSNKLLANLETNRNYIAVFPNDTTIMWWCMCFVMPPEWFRKVLFDAIEKTQKDCSWINLLYADWLDGWEYEGMRFDQDIENWIYSKFLNTSNYIIKNIDWTSNFGSYEDCINKDNNWIMLDTVNNKIHIKWKKVTSEELHSQSATIEILKILIENIWIEIPNKKLPLSSYSKNKNEMLGKIVIPLIELVEKELKQKLPLICKWSIRDFYVKLNKTNINISIIQKAQTNIC